MTVHKNKQSLNFKFEDEFDTEDEREERIETSKTIYNMTEVHSHDLFFTKGMSSEGKFVLYTCYRYKHPVTPRHTPVDKR